MSTTFYSELCDTPEENYKDYVNENFISNLLSKLKNPKVIDDSLYSILQIIAEIAKTGSFFYLSATGFYLKFIILKILAEICVKKKNFSLI